MIEEVRSAARDDPEVAHRHHHADIQALLGQVPEGRTIDYKRQLPGGSDADKKEFLADVSSFANTAGGDLIFGLSEAGGLPTAIVGVTTTTDIDADVLRLDGIILTGLAPRISHHFLKVPCGTSMVLVLRVEQSWISPHRVTFKSHDKFYARTSAGKYALDVIELRQAFLRTTSAAEQIRIFREGRLVEIGSGRTPVPLVSGARLVLHFIPLEAFTLARQVDVASFYQKPDRLPPVGHSGWGHRITIDGLLTYSSHAGGSTTYTQLYRNGVIEAVNASTIVNRQDDDTTHFIPSVSFEQTILQSIRPYLYVQRDLGVTPPIYILLSLIGVKGYRMGVRNVLGDQGDAIDREVLELPEAVVSNFSEDVVPTMRGPIDLVWNACGFPSSPNFNDSGQWTAR